MLFPNKVVSMLRHSDTGSKSTLFCSKMFFLRKFMVFRIFFFVPNQTNKPIQVTQIVFYFRIWDLGNPTKLNLDIPEIISSNTEPRWTNRESRFETANIAPRICSVELVALIARHHSDMRFRLRQVTLRRKNVFFYYFYTSKSKEIPSWNS